MKKCPACAAEMQDDSNLCYRCDEFVPNIPTKKSFNHDSRPVDNSDYNSRGTATHFAEWVFAKNNPNYQASSGSWEVMGRQRLGRLAHTEIDKISALISQKKTSIGVSSKWELVYSDPHTDEERKIFSSSCLLVNNQPMRCRPDVVFRDKDTGLIIVLERKITSRGEIPQDAWANVRAQVWCYGWIDEWAGDADVILICQYYSMRVDWTYSGGGELYQDKKAPWILHYDVFPSWRRSSKRFHDECLRYFSEYGGVFDSKRKSENKIQ